MYMSERKEIQSNLNQTQQRKKLDVITLRVGFCFWQRAQMQLHRIEARLGSKEKEHSSSALKTEIPKYKIMVIIKWLEQR